MVFTEGTVVAIVIFLIANVGGFVWSYSKLTSITENQQKEIEQLRKMIEEIKKKEDGRNDEIYKIQGKLDLIIERILYIREDVDTMKKRLSKLEE